MSSKVTSHRPLIVAVVGYTGGVGTCLIQSMKTIGLTPYSLVRSSTMSFVDDNKGNNNNDNSVPTDYALLAQRVLQRATAENAVPVIADVTASATVQTHYAAWLRAGISVVAANKGIFAGPMPQYAELWQAAATGHARLLHETTVGAGLPTLGTIQNLVASAHRITRVEGILSGTLAYVLGQVAGGKVTLSQAVLAAQKLGYTEPDPRDDLNGLDVARKAVILARLAGCTNVELENMSIESLVPPSLRDCSVQDFLQNLPLHDAAMAERVAAVEAAGGRLHYAAAVDVTTNTVTVGLQSCPASHPFNNAGPDNMVAITTNYYTRPLVIQGAGAGGHVTATGVLADILACAYQ